MQPKLRYFIVPNFGQDVDEKDLFYVAGGKGNWYNLKVWPYLVKVSSHMSSEVPSHFAQDTGETFLHLSSRDTSRIVNS